MVTYRHIFFKDGILTHGNGTITVRFYGQLYPYAMKMKNFRELYDQKLDLFISCNDCASSKYKDFVRINPGHVD